MCRVLQFPALWLLKVGCWAIACSFSLALDLQIWALKSLTGWGWHARLGITVASYLILGVFLFVCFLYVSGTETTTNNNNMLGEAETVVLTDSPTLLYCIWQLLWSFACTSMHFMRLIVHVSSHVAAVLIRYPQVLMSIVSIYVSRIIFSWFRKVLTQEG